MNDELKTKRCKACEGGVEPLSPEASTALAGQLDAGWELSADGLQIQRDFSFSGFYKTMNFVNAVAWIANTENHHPDLEVGYGHCLVRYTTHAIGGLSENDFICAAKIDALLIEPTN